MAQTIELADGVYRIATDNYRLNTGLILGLEAALVIDTGAGPRQGTEIYRQRCFRGHGCGGFLGAPAYRAGYRKIW